jgi:AbrB family looped-hinge helix DNA binding protein
VTNPKEIRDALRLKRGDRLVFFLRVDEQAILRK